jgi:hypothetical protein
MEMAVTLRVQRSRGALSGVLLVLLGIWGAIVPFVGPYFNYAYTPDSAWSYTSGRMWLEILPGVAAILGGLVVLLSGHRAIAILGAWLAAVAGTWFAVGSLVAVVWISSSAAGTPVGGPRRVLLEQLGFFTGLGVVIVFVAALAIGRFTVVGVRDAARGARGGGTAEAEQPKREQPKRELPRVPLVPAFLRGRSGPGDEGQTAEKTPAKTS